MTHNENFPIPSALYKCADYRCARRRSYPADELYFEAGSEAGWYCAGCLGRSIEGRPRLDREIARRDANALEAEIKAAFEQEA